MSPDKPCPVCGKPDWCLFTEDGTAAICPRTESPRDLGKAGFLHRLGEGQVPDREPKGQKRVFLNMTALAEKYRKEVRPGSLEFLAQKLGVSGASLRAFRVGWFGFRMSWTFPSYNPLLGEVTGIQLRKPSGEKSSVKGSRYALFLPQPLPDDETLLVCEGPTDAVAAHGAGFPMCAARHNCSAGYEYVVALVMQKRPGRVLVVADNDEPDHLNRLPGIEGAMKLAEKLSYHHKDVRVFTPPEPHKDLRDWVKAGAKRAEIEGKK